jgi:hypothetical protein
MAYNPNFVRPHATNQYYPPAQSLLRPADVNPQPISHHQGPGPDRFAPRRGGYRGGGRAGGLGSRSGPPETIRQQNLPPSSNYNQSFGVGDTPNAHAGPSVYGDRQSMGYGRALSPSMNTGNNHGEQIV